MAKNIFYTKFSEISSNRLDPFFYIPEIVELENQVKKVSTKKLKDFVISVSSGATPKKSIENEYYSENEKDGIPFLRVQNLSKYGKLDFDGLKFITKDTHQKMLKRSQVEEDDLLVKITGVGRMAIASVPEKGFVGNTNQHMVVIKTKDRRTSETLATYLNLDIAEKLASRRATGGTRPALDYPALLSIPVVYDETIVSKLSDAYRLKEQKEKEAQNKLESIDEYLLRELEIQPFSDEKETLKDRVFFRKFSELSGDRFDSSFHSYKNTYYKYIDSKYEVCSFSKIIDDMQTGLPIRKDYREFDGKYPYYGANGIIGFMNEYTHFGQYLIIGQDGYIGNHYVVNCKFWASNHTWVIKIKDGININYIKYFLDVWKYDYLITGGVIPKITKNAVSSIQIPLPPIEIQNKIAKHIQNLRDEAQVLKDEAIQIFEDAKKEVENMILGEKNA